MPREDGKNRCGHCHGLGHNIRGCPTYKQQREAVEAKVGEELRTRAETIRQLEQQLQELRQREEANRQRGQQVEGQPAEQVSLEELTLSEDLKLENAKREAVVNVLGEEEKRQQSPGAKILPALAGMVSSAFMFLAQYRDRIPHADTIALSLLILTPGFAVFMGFEWVRGMWARQHAKTRAQEAASRAQDSRRVSG
jgi:hypothetical protein